MSATGKRILTLLIAFAVIVSTLAHVPAKIAKAANDVGNIITATIINANILVRIYNSPLNITF